MQNIGEGAQDQRRNGSLADTTALIRPYPPEKMWLLPTGYEKKDLLA